MNILKCLLFFSIMVCAGCGSKSDVNDGDDGNDTPIVSIKTNQLSVIEGSAITIEASGTDSDGTIVSYLWAQDSGVAVLLTPDNASAVTFTAPQVDADSQVVLSVTVTDDDGATASVQVTVDIRDSSDNSNLAPRIDQIPASVTLAENDSMSINALASDPDGDITSYQWSQVSGINVTLADSATATVSVTAPEVIADSQAVLQLTVTDNSGATATAQITLVITNTVAVNMSPQVNIGSGKLTISEGQSATIVATASDPDGSIVEYQWRQLSGIDVTFTVTADNTIVLVAPAVTADAVVQIGVDVVDNDGASASAAVTVTISNDDSTLIWPNELSSANGDQWLRDHHDQITELRPRVLVLDPDRAYTEDVSQREVQALAVALAEGSRYHGYKNSDAPVFLNPQIERIVHLRDPVVIERFFGTDTDRMGQMEPLFTQEFANHIGWQDPDNPARNMTLCELFEKGHINEVWSHGLPTVIFETQSRQQIYDDNMQPIAGHFSSCANGCVDFGEAGQCGVTVRMMFVNPRRGTGCDVHGHGHMMESLGESLPLLRKYSDRFWGKRPQAYYPSLPSIFSLYRCRYNATCFEFLSPRHIRTTDSHHDSYELLNWGKSCGLVHFAPNSTGHYDYYNNGVAANSCENYGLGNDGNGEDLLSYYSADTTRDLDQDSRFSDCGGGWQIYMRQSMPGYQNQARDEDGNVMKNWWPFLYY